MCVQFYLLLVAFRIAVGFPVASIELSDIEQRQRLREQQQQRLDIYKRQNSAFNRLQSNKIDYSVYSSFNDQAPASQEQNDMSASESRRFGGRRRPCVPVYSYRMGKKQRRNDGRFTDGRYDGRTLYDLNFYFLGYQPDRYQVNPGTQTVSAIAAVDNNPVSQNQNYDHNGGYYLCRPPNWVGSNDYYGDGGQYNDPSRPSYLGSLGQGLFDFINGLFGYGNPNAGSGGAGGSGGYDTPVNSGTGTVLNESTDEKPVFEINVPDTIAALVMHLFGDSSIFSIVITMHIFIFFFFYRTESKQLASRPISWWNPKLCKRICARNLTIYSILELLFSQFYVINFIC